MSDCPFCNRPESTHSDEFGRYEACIESIMATVEADPQTRILEQRINEYEEGVSNE